MSDNIIDFNELKHQKEASSAEHEISPQDLAEHLASLPENDMMNSVIQATGRRTFRMLMLTDIAAQVSQLLESLGFDPDNFSVDDESVDRFICGDADYNADMPWNGPYFIWDATDETLVQAVTTVQQGEPDRQGVPVHMLIDILKLDDDADKWARFIDGEWKQDGPPAATFDDIEFFWECLHDLQDEEEWGDDEDDEDDVDEDDDDEEDTDDEVEEEDVDIVELDLTPELFQILNKAGIETVSQLENMSNKDLMALEGIDRMGLFQIKKALRDYDMFGGE